MSIHWWMAGCYLILFVGARVMLGAPTEGSGRGLLYATHKSFGVLVLLLLAGRGYLLVRVWGRKYSKHLPKLTSNWYFKTGLHTLLYVLMLAVPLSGYWLSNAYRANNISLFGLPMPDLFPVNAAGLAVAGAAHSRTSQVFAILIVIHSIAQHRVVTANWRRLSTWVGTLGFRL